MENEVQNKVSEKQSFFKFIGSLAIFKLVKDWKAGKYSKEEMQWRLSTAISSGILMAACILAFLSIFLLMWCDDPRSCQYQFLGVGVKNLPNLAIIGYIIALLNYFALYKNKKNILLVSNIVASLFAIFMFILLNSITK